MSPLCLVTYIVISSIIIELKLILFSFWYLTPANFQQGLIHGNNVCALSNKQAIEANKHKTKTRHAKVKLRLWIFLNQDTID